MTPDEARDHMWNIATKIRADGFEVDSVGFLLHGDVLAVVPLSDRPKEKWKPALEVGAAQPGAIMVGLICEAWAIKGRDPADTATVHAAIAAGCSVSELPGALEVLNLVSEESDGSAVTYVADISEDGTLGEREVIRTTIDPDLPKGQMSGFFPTRSENGYQVD